MPGTRTRASHRKVSIEVADGAFPVASEVWVSDSEPRLVGRSIRKHRALGPSMATTSMISWRASPRRLVVVHAVSKQSCCANDVSCKSFARSSPIRTRSPLDSVRYRFNGLAKQSESDVMPLKVFRLTAMTMPSHEWHR